MTITKKVNIINDIRGHVLDDDKDFNEIVAEIFRLNGLSNIYFYDNTKLFMTNMSENVHLCMIDLNTDEGPLEGLSVARIVRKKYPNCKIIMTSFTPTNKTYETMIDIGINAFVNKEYTNYQDRVVKVIQRNISDIKEMLELAQLLEEDKKIRKPKNSETNSDY